MAYIIIGVLIIGLLRNIWNLYQNRKNLSLIQAFDDQLKKLFSKYNQNKTYDKELAWILYHTEAIASTIHPLSRKELDELNSDLVNEPKYFPGSAREVSCLTIKWIAEINRRGKNILFVFLNPFVWFYMGVESVLEYTVGYLVKVMNPDVDFHSGWWKALNVIVSFVGGLASIYQLFK